MLTGATEGELTSRQQRRLAFSAALLFLLGGLTGIPLALAQTGQLGADPKAMLGAHLNALSGCFWLVGVGWSLTHCRLSRRLAELMCWLVTIASYGNWALTGLKAVLEVRGLTLTGEGANDLVAVGLNVFVVLPTLLGSGLWAFGLRPARAGH